MIQGKPVEGLNRMEAVRMQEENAKSARMSINL